MNHTSSAAETATCPICKGPLPKSGDEPAANSLAAIDIYAVPMPKEEA